MWPDQDCVLELGSITSLDIDQGRICLDDTGIHKIFQLNRY
jgi:hypothetical protein